MSAQRDLRDHGRIPFRLRIGATGHRRLDGQEALTAQVRRALDRIRELGPSSPHTPVLFTVVSPLAEGADRLVAKEVVRDEAADLEVPLPLPQEEYLRDFESDASRQEFYELLARATSVTRPILSRSREEAYQQVGRYIVDRSDVLIALWDGQPSRGQGGTGEIVQYARERGTPLLWISTTGRHEIVEEVGSGISPGAFRQLDEYNRRCFVEERLKQ